jgi:hypothetical protein
MDFGGNNSANVSISSCSHTSSNNNYKRTNMTGGGAAAQNQTGATPETTSMTATNFTAQKTAMSTVDTLPGHQMHQAVVVLPQRTVERFG